MTQRCRSLATCLGKQDQVRQLQEETPRQGKRNHFHSITWSPQALRKGENAPLAHFWSWSTVDTQATLVHRPTSEKDHGTQHWPKRQAGMKSNEPEPAMCQEL